MAVKSNLWKKKSICKNLNFKHLHYETETKQCLIMLFGMSGDWLKEWYWFITK